MPEMHYRALCKYLSIPPACSFPLREYSQRKLSG
jgi:hypothetical protein